MYPNCGASLGSRGLFYGEKEGGFCWALWPCGTHHSPRAPPQPSSAWPALHDARRMEIYVAHNPQLPQRSATTNSLGLPNPASLATRPIPPHSDPPAPPICTYEPSTLRHAPDIKPSYKHHVKLQNRSIFHPKSGADIAVTLNVPRQSFSFPD